MQLPREEINATHIRPNKSIDFSQNMTVHAFF